MWVKVCGNTNVSDALSTIQAGADALGFIFVPTSRRCVSRKKAEEILSALPRTVLTVAVVADESPEFLKGLLRVCPFTGLQFHGDESPEEVLAFKGQARLMKTIRVKSGKSLDLIPKYQGVDAILLDTYRKDKPGGTGFAFDWSLAKEAISFGIPIVVAGGLNPSNVADLIRQAKPYGVDVASGVEAAPGQKDQALVREFVIRAKSCI